MTSQPDAYPEDSGMPPCPHCGREVRNCRVESLDQGYNADFTRVQPARRFELEPCGHEVRGYDGDSYGKVLRWHT